MENNYCAVARYCEQVSPDDWEMKTRTMQLTKSTTVKELADWFKSITPNRTHIHILVTELETPQL